ncbi:hypothetical protein [Peptostreptococcus anaerobius]|uniref:Uncharacterized protein n=1 Tax=Peptostreptococcus anaerobius TaxID=1261 RepID=A0A135YZ46_9FIRM|nr:hypothetical protein [Peptostreptococcus anaerobius]KXI14665.1 hypothetical protein HMPREF3195_00120 [Peptostreptococcus anaerobius]
MPKNYDENLAEYKQLKEEASEAIDQLIKSKNNAIEEKAEYINALTYILNTGGSIDKIVEGFKSKNTTFTSEYIKDNYQLIVYPKIESQLEILNSDTSGVEKKAKAKSRVIYLIASALLYGIRDVGISIDAIGINTKTGELTMNNIGIGKFLTIDTENKSIELSNTKKNLFKFSMKELIRNRLLQYNGDVRVVSDSNILNYMWENKKQMLGADKYLTGSFIVLEISSGNAHNVNNNWGYVTLRDGTQPDWSNYKGKYKFLEQYPQIVTFMKNDTESDDYIYYYEI